MTEIIPDLSTFESNDVNRMAERQALLDAFGEKPQDDSIWQTAFNWVMSEGDRGGSAIADSLPGAELIEMANTVRSTVSSDRYNLMASRASNGELWFDIIEGFSSNQVRKIQKEIIRSWLNLGEHPVLFQRGLDLGTGTGKSLETLEGSAEQVVGLDGNHKLLSIAKARAGEKTRLVQGYVDALPFEDDSFDLVASLGIHAALDKDTATGFYRELARVMMPGGVYVASFYHSRDDGSPNEELARFTLSSKAMLTDMIGDTVSGALDITERFEGDDKDNLLSNLGLNETYYDVLNADGVTRNLVSIVTRA